MNRDWELPIKQADASDFLGLSPPSGYRPPTRRNISVPSSLPEPESLFNCQNNILRSLQALDRLEEDNPDLHWEGLTHHLRQVYKTLNTYLKSYG